MIGRYSIGAIGLAAAAGLVFLLLGEPMQATGLLAGSILSAANFYATSRVLVRARDARAGTGGTDPVGGMRTVAGFMIRYFLLGGVLVLLILVAGLPAVPTLLGVAAVPLTIYLWQILKLLTGRWRS